MMLRTVGRALVAVALLCPPLAAQNPGFGDAAAISSIALSLGATATAVNDLNGVLATAGFAALPRAAWSLGVTGQYAFGRALLGADIARALFSEQGAAAGRVDGLGASQFEVTAGYAVFTDERLTLFPVLGVGIGRFQVTLRDPSGTPAASAAQPTFAELAQSPGASSTITGNHLLFSVGGGADYMHAQSGLVLGVRAGVSVAPNRTTWTSNGRTVIVGPFAATAGPYVRVVIGSGGR